MISSSALLSGGPDVSTLRLMTLKMHPFSFVCNRANVHGLVEPGDDCSVVK